MNANMSAQKNGKPTSKQQELQTYLQVETGIYRYKDGDGNITYHERPWIISENGNPVRTYRALGFGFTRQANLNIARTEYYRRRTEVSAGRNPYEDPKKDKIEKPTVKLVVEKYVAAHYPDRYLKARTGRTLEAETAKCAKLLEYCGSKQPWDNCLWDSLTPKNWDDYHDWRLVQINGEEDDADENVDSDLEPEEPRGNRSVDLERNTLNNAYKYGIRKELITANPVVNFPRFHSQSDVHHCREFQPENADELHSIAATLFSERSSEALAWQLLFEANTGLRTSEILKLRMDADGFGQAGFVDPEDNLHVDRVKRGINPFVHCHDGLKALLKAHAIWHSIRYPGNPYLIPGKLPGQPASRRSLAHALHRLRKAIGRKITSHGMRAFYVFVRRSWGIDDGLIAVELGQGSGAGLIATTYGGVPPNWRNGGGSKLMWLPKGEPAWAELERSGWKNEAVDQQVEAE